MCHCSAAGEGRVSFTCCVAHFCTRTPILRCPFIQPASASALLLPCWEKRWSPVCCTYMRCAVAAPHACSSPAACGPVRRSGRHISSKEVRRVVHVGGRTVHAQHPRPGACWLAGRDWTHVCCATQHHPASQFTGPEVFCEALVVPNGHGVHRAGSVRRQMGARPGVRAVRRRGGAGRQQRQWQVRGGGEARLWAPSPPSAATASHSTSSTSCTHSQAAGQWAVGHGRACKRA